MFKLRSDYKPAGDQPQAIEKLLNGIKGGKRHQVLLGVTGSGKTYTVANVISRLNRPTLVISHNKTLAAQLAQEYKEFFPENSVEYFVSYYDYYQPEAYIPQTDQYIEKEADINQEIDRLRLSTTASLTTRKDVIVVASVSCIYNLGSPEEFKKSVIELSIGSPVQNSKNLERDALTKKLVELFYDRSDLDFRRSTFRVRGEFIDIWPSNDLNGIRLEFDLKGLLKCIRKISPVSGQVIENLKRVFIYPAKHYISDKTTYEKVFLDIRSELDARVKDLDSRGKLLESHRLRKRTEYDLETIKALGYCSGIENYSRYFENRSSGEPPFTLLDYFEKLGDWLLVVDESHITIPQIRGMYLGDRTRKQTLIDYGFRLPSAADNRPLRFDEFMRKIPETLYTSATPEPWELSLSENQPVEQLIRPTGLLDPKVEVRKSEGQIEDLIKEIEIRVSRKERVLVTTLTKRFSEELTSFLQERKIKVQYLHSDIETLERSDILDDLRRGNYDVVVGINLLREGLDLPEVSLVAILDADKEGFLRSRTSFIQTMGRAARHVNGRVIMYADRETGSMKSAIDEVTRRRRVQEDYNHQHHIRPQSIIKSIRSRLIEKTEEKEKEFGFALSASEILKMSPEERKEALKTLEQGMKESADYLDFEMAAKYRDLIREIKKEQLT